MSKRKKSNSQNTDKADNEAIKSAEQELDQQAEEQLDEMLDEQNQHEAEEKIDEIIDESDDDQAESDLEHEEIEDMNQPTEQDQGFDQEPAPVTASGSGGSGKASAAMAMSLLALAGTGYNWYDTRDLKSGQSGSGEQAAAVDYSAQILSLEQQIQSLTESQEKLTAMSAASSDEQVDTAIAGTADEVSAETAALGAETEQTAMTETESSGVVESDSDSSTSTKFSIAETDDQTTEQSEEVVEAETEEPAVSEVVSESATDEIAGQVAEPVAAVPDSDEIKQIAIQQVDEVLAQAKQRLGLNEVAQLLSIGEQRLALAGDVAGAQAAFGIANERLSAFADPVVDSVRESVAANIESLNAVEVVDKTALTQDLDNLATAVDGLAFKPLETLADEAPTEEVVEEAGTEETTEVETEESSNAGLSLEGAGSLLKSWGSKIGDTIGDVGTGIAGDLKDMVRIKKTGPLSDVVLAPEQEYFIRENMKLTLGGAQRAVLQGNGGVYQQNIGQAQSLLSEYFDADNEDVQSVAGRLADLAQINLEPELPDVSGSSTSLTEVLKQLAAADSSAN